MQLTLGRTESYRMPFANSLAVGLRQSPNRIDQAVGV